MRGSILEHVGILYRPEPAPILLERGRPLSQLWAELPDGRVHLARAIADARGEHLRRRLPVLLDQTADTILQRLSETLVSPVFLCLGDLAYLDHEQVLTLGPRLQRTEERAAIGQLVISPIFRLSADAGQLAVQLDRFWASGWGYADGREQGDDWWRVWPQGSRGKIREDFVASLSSAQWENLGRPRYVVIENPSDPAMCLPAVVRRDPPGTELNSADYEHERIVALDASCRDALGILDGEFCRMRVWPGRHVARRAQRRLIGARSIVAHVKIAARVDLEKPVCRLGTDALVAIGARPEDDVIVESVVADAQTFKRHRLTLRALPIEAAEASSRAAWERARGSDGWIDPAAFHGINPPYPAIYLDFPAREALQVSPAAPVVVRTNVRRRISSEASDFLWVAVAGVIVALIHFGWLPAGSAVALIAAAAALLAWLRIRRAVR